MITNFDKAACRVLGAEIATALEAIAKKHGLTVAPAGGTIGIGGLDFTAKIAFKVTDTKAVETIERAEFAKYCSIYNLTPDKYLAAFENKGTRYAVVGFEIGRSKFPIKVRRLEDGKVFGFAEGILAKVR